MSGRGRPGFAENKESSMVVLTGSVSSMANLGPPMSFAYLGFGGREEESPLDR